MTTLAAGLIVAVTTLIRVWLAIVIGVLAVVVIMGGGGRLR